jgi:Lhr-like helicase
MRAFSFDRQVIEKYEAFSRSFTRIRAADLAEEVNSAHDRGYFWPEPLLSINPAYQSAATATRLADQELILPETADVFRVNGEPLTFYVHQEQAISKAANGRSFVVTTGTGSGKSLCFFVPIIDAAIRARKAGKFGTRAVIVYPMNALANSQEAEIKKFLDQSGLPDHLKPRVERYTGQEKEHERRQIAQNPPDVLLTNFMMLELLMTRQDEVDAAVISNAKGLQFIVLDELHTYRGRQGADVAVLVRRLRERCRGEQDPVCIGTSATMASESDDAQRAKEVASVSSRLFGVELGPDAVIDECLKRATDPALSLEDINAQLPHAVSGDLPSVVTDAALRRNPLAVWIELKLGLDDSKGLRRRRPKTMQEAAKDLAEAAGVTPEVARRRLEDFLAILALPEKERGGSSDRAFMAFKLHRFIAGAGDIRTTLQPPPRRVLFEGQKTDPKDPEARLYPSRFCRECGQEYHIVTLWQKEGQTFALPRDIDDEPVKQQREGEAAGYLTPFEEQSDEFRFSGEISSYPEDWLQEQNGVLQLRANRKASQPSLIYLRADGVAESSGRPFCFIPGKFRFCLACGHQPNPQTRERNKLGGLSAEGRSSATTTLVTGMLDAFNASDSGVAEEKRKVLAFTDNRQDAALQAGHFNDSTFVSLLRGATLRAVLDAGEDGLCEENFGRAVQRALGFVSERGDARTHWMLQPDVKGTARIEAAKTLARVLAHRVWADQRRGWRFTYPNLAGVKLVDAEFSGLSDLLEDTGTFLSAPAPFSELDADRRMTFLETLLTAMLEALAVDTEALEPQAVEALAQRSRQVLRFPWAIDEKEEPRTRTALVVRAPSRRQQNPADDMALFRAGFRSGLARRLNHPSLLGTRLSGEEFDVLMEHSLVLLEQYGIARRITTAQDLEGWQLNPASIRLVSGPSLENPEQADNLFFHRLYSDIAQALAAGSPAIIGYEGREHTAQVSQRHREWREWRFRSECADKERIENAATELRDAGENTGFLPALFCSPTMELGVDISALDAVYLRNVPPTPANYAQRAGCGGRSGQAAVITTYCAAQSPHDQYYFRKRRDMVAGFVRPPALDLANEDLLRSHLHAVWLAASGKRLAPDIPDVLDLAQENAPLRADIREALEDPDLAERAAPAMRRVVEAVLPFVDQPLPDGLGDPRDFVEMVLVEALEKFEQAFDRWRLLHRSAKKQLSEANVRSQQTGLSASERREVRAAWNQANDQIGLLENGRANSGSDFYTYRYLATEGFLPGYNFPRLPLYAFVPGKGGHREGTYLQRARFVAISEFGPRSFIYHEGKRYRVDRAKLNPNTISDDGRSLATRDFYVCPSCGASHDTEIERCHACGTALSGGLPITNTLRIDNVETVPAERITANEEDRERQGFEIQTVFSWPKRRGRVDVKEAWLEHDGACLATLQYGEGAQISRLNLGLRRRRDKTAYGFYINPRSGKWTKLENEDEEAGPDHTYPVRVVPVVQDDKNALLFRLANPEHYAPEAIATLQHALLRGIEAAFQLEEGEILGEPLPTADNRRAVLFYEAAEGGAGVLGKLIRNGDALQRVASAALELMHYEGVADAITAGDPAVLQEADDAPCVQGCYRCLLSYYNQPDHEGIDRRNLQALDLLVRIAAGSVSEPGSVAVEDNWRMAFERAGLPSPDARSIVISDVEIPYVWRDHFVAATIGPLPPKAQSKAEADGWEIVPLEDDGNYAVPGVLLDLLKVCR